MNRARGLGLFLLAAMLSSGCRQKDPPRATSTPPAATVPPPATSPPEGAPAPSVPVPLPSGSTDATLGAGLVLSPAKACRAIAVKGRVTREGGAALVTGAVLDRPAWLELAKGAELAVKHADTSRELVFRGPGRVLPCDRGEERYLLVRGEAGTTTWAGARPGAEVLVATPFGVVLYGDAKLAIRVDAQGLSVKAEVGDAWIDGPGAKVPEEKVSAGGLATRKGPAPNVKALMAGCLEAAESAAARAREVLAPGRSASPLGVRAAEHVRARRAARAACAVAAVAVGSLEMGQDRDDLGRGLGVAEARWRGMP